MLAERLGLDGSVYAGRPDQVSRRERLAREFCVARHGDRLAAESAVDLYEILVQSREILAGTSNARTCRG